MIPNEKYREIASQLLAKSRANEVNWQAGSSKPSPSYDVRLPESVIRVAQISPSTEPDYVRVSLCKPNGQPVDHWIVEEGDPDWELAYSLYTEAHRCVTGWDRVLTDVEKSLTEEGVIGLPVGATGNGSQEREIPF